MTDHVIVSISPDECPDPREGDCNWRLVSFCQRHTAFEHPDRLFNVRKEDGVWNFYPRDLVLRRRLDVGLAHMLSYFEHGNCVWFRKGHGLPGTDCRFDGVRHAGLLVWEHGPDAMGAKTYEDRGKDADAFLKCYTDWCNGHGLSVDARTSTGEYLDSCGGYYGSDSDHVVSEATAVVVGSELPWVVSEESLCRDELVRALRSKLPALEYKG